MKNLSKEDGQRIHAKKRFSERYNSKITDEQLDELSRDVRRGYCQPVSKVTNRLMVFKSGEWVFAYDKHRKSIATFLTEDMIDNYIEIEKHNQERKQNIRNLEAKKLNDITVELMGALNIK
jgi:valyl-tRNA synthetase